MSTENYAPVTRQAIAARDRSLPGKVTGRLKRVLDAMVWEAASPRRARAIGLQHRSQA
jgi:hypothetical protein